MARDETGDDKFEGIKDAAGSDFEFFLSCQRGLFAAPFKVRKFGRVQRMRSLEVFF